MDYSHLNTIHHVTLYSLRSVTLVCGGNDSIQLHESFHDRPQTARGKNSYFVRF